MFCALLGQNISRAFTGPLVLWFSNQKPIYMYIGVCKSDALGTSSCASQLLGCDIDF